MKRERERETKRKEINKKERRKKKRMKEEREKKFQMRKINYAIQKNGNDRKKVELLHIFQQRIFERRKKRAMKESDFKSKIFSLSSPKFFFLRESEIERGKRIMRKKRKNQEEGNCSK